MEELLAPFAGERSVELACLLRNNFGSLGRALAAPESELRNADGKFAEVCDLLIAAKRLVDAARTEKLHSERVDPQNADFLDYVRSRICRAREERLLVFFCDGQQRYLIDEEMGWGDAQHVRLDLAQLFDRAEKLDASRLLLAHNHPSGLCRPSDDDVRSTRRIVDAARSFGIWIVDHLIMTREKAYSMRAGGWL